MRRVEHGTAFDPGRLFRVDTAAAPLSFRLCHSSVRLNAIAEAVRRLARAWLVFRRHALAVSVGR